jgi:2-keto-4-pentenoate hydratase/2-oxohepta-3-ene-1,7-dioic acid hydratase in catechol pathway
VNGEERLRCQPESAVKILEGRKGAAPGEVIPCRLGNCADGRIEVKPGDTVEIEATRIGRLRNRVV